MGFDHSKNTQEKLMNLSRKKYFYS